MHKVGVALFVLITTFGCGKLAEITDPSGGGPPVDPTATFTRVKAEIFAAQSCTALGCHDPIGRQQNLRLTPDIAYSQIVRVPSEQMPALQRIEPGDFANSYLYRKLTGVGITGERMPSGGPYLNEVQIALVRDWIRRGAPND